MQLTAQSDIEMIVKLPGEKKITHHETFARMRCAVLFITLKSDESMTERQEIIKRSGLHPCKKLSFHSFQCRDCPDGSPAAAVDERNFGEDQQLNKHPFSQLSNSQSTVPFSQFIDLHGRRLLAGKSSADICPWKDSTALLSPAVGLLLRSLYIERSI